MRARALVPVVALAASVGEGGGAAAAAETIAARHEGTPGGLGLGVGLGHPTGFVVKRGLGGRLAIQGGLGTGTLNGRGWHVHVDLLYVPTVLSRAASHTVALYVGAGARYWDHVHSRTSRYEEGHDEHVGLRVPLGLALVFGRAPVDVFLEGALVVDGILTDPCRLCDDEERLQLNVMIGARYWVGGRR